MLVSHLNLVRPSFHRKQLLQITTAIADIGKQLWLIVPKQFIGLHKSSQSPEIFFVPDTVPIVCVPPVIGAVDGPVHLVSQVLLQNVQHLVPIAKG
jgi:hypothetical protein